MNILIYGQNESFRFEFSINRYLLKSNNNIIFFDPTKYTENLYAKLLDKIDKYSFLRNFYFSKLNKEFYKYVFTHRPSLIIIISLNFLMPKTINLIKKLGIIVFILFQDNPLPKAFCYSYRYETLKLAKSCSRYFVISRLLSRYLKLNKNIDSIYYPQMYDTDLIPIIRQKKIYDISFVGNLDNKRIDYIRKISLFYKINIWTNLKYVPNDFFNNKNIQVNDNVYGKDYANIIAKSKINLNILRLQNIHIQSLTQRDIEISSTGNLLLREYTLDGNFELSKFKNVFFYKNIDELLLKIKKILSTNCFYIDVDNTINYSYDRLIKLILDEYRLKSI